MPYVGGSLVSLFGREPQAATRLAARRMADKGVDRWQSVTTENTPIDTGNLRTSWYTLPAQKVLSAVGDAYVAKIESQVSYAPHVEYGTGLWGPSHSKYKISPKSPGGMLRWIDPKSGDMVYARSVMHPGSPGQHMVQIGAEVARAEAFEGPLFEGILADWARAVEASAD